MAESSRSTDTRRKRPNYLLLNDGYDDEVSLDDRLPRESLVSGSVDASSEILPSESVSQVIDLATTHSGVSLAQPPTKRVRSAPTTDWVWQHFAISRIDREWISKRTGKKNTVDHGR